MSAVRPVPVSSLRFKKLGTVQFPDPPYTETDVSAALPHVKSLLAVSNRYGTLFLLSAVSSSSSFSTLYVASTQRLMDSVQAASGAQALRSQPRDAGDEGGGSSRVQDARAADDVFRKVLLQTAGVWLLSLSPADDWLLVAGSDGCGLYQTSQFPHLTGGDSQGALLHVQSEAVVDVQWAPGHLRTFYTLTPTGRLRRYAITSGVLSVQCEMSYDSPSSPITAFLPCAKIKTTDQVILGLSDGSLHVGSILQSSASSVLRLRTSRPPHWADDFSTPVAVHHISQLSDASLLLGYAQPRFEQSPVVDPVRTALSTVSYPALSYFASYGDLLQDESRVLPSARHRYGLLPVPGWRCALVWSNRTGEPRLLGENPALRNGGGGAAALYVPYELESDAARVFIPSDADWGDAFAIGAALDLTNHTSTAETDEKGAETDAPFPLLLLLTTDSRLHLFHFICNQPSMREASALVMRKETEPLPTCTIGRSPFSHRIERAARSAPPAAEEKTAAAPPPAVAAAPLPFSLPTFTFSADAAAPTFSVGSSSSSSSSSSSTAASLFAAMSTLSPPSAASQTARQLPAWNFTPPAAFACASSSSSSSGSGNAPDNSSSALSSFSTGLLLPGGVGVNLPAAVPAAAALPTQPASSAPQPAPYIFSAFSASTQLAAAAAEAESDSKAEAKAQSAAEVEAAPSSSPAYPGFLSESQGYVKDAFVEAVDSDWCCPVCTGVCRDAETSVCCQQLACRRCVSAWFDASGSSSCPLCGGSPCSRADFLPTPYIDRRIRSLNIRCPQGCDARGLVIGVKERTLQEHVEDNCPRRRKLCPNRCRASYAAQDEALHLLRDCLNRPVSCRHGCGQLLNPSDAHTHFAHCGMNRAPCPLVCFETVEQQAAAAAAGLPSSARRYYADSSSSVSAYAASAASVLFDAMDTKRWLVARATQKQDARVLVHYEHWHCRWDEWLPADSDRIAPLNTHTAPTTPPDAYNLSTARTWLASHPSSSPPPPPAVVFPSSLPSSASAVLSRSLIQIAAVDHHMKEVCPNRPTKQLSTV